MLAKPKVLVVFSLLVLIATVWALSPTPASGQTPAKSVRDNFGQPKETIEYHFMLKVSDIREKDVEKTLQVSVVDPLKPLVEMERLGKPRSGIYIDSRNYVLDKSYLTVRVRQGQITVRSRGATPEILIDVGDCGSKKYEMDYFVKPYYSISSDIKFKPEEFATTPPALTIPGLWEFMEKKCPALFSQIQPYLKDAAIEIPGVATMYSADIKLNHPLATKLKEAGLTVWFFPPTDQTLVEFAFTGYNRDREDLDKLYAEIMESVKKAGLLNAEQISKTRQYFRAYWGTLPPTE
jgi:hypothetical protein